MGLIVGLHPSSILRKKLCDAGSFLALFRNFLTQRFKVVQQFSKPLLLLLFYLLVGHKGLIVQRNDDAHASFTGFDGGARRRSRFGLPQQATGLMVWLKGNGHKICFKLNSPLKM